jgi:CRP-like cAMP-binding protein
MTPRAAADRGPLLVAAPYMATGAGEVVQLLTAKQREQLIDIGEKQVAPVGHMFYRQGTPAKALFCCTEGAVKTYRELPSGTQRITAFLFGGDVFGMAEAGTYVNTARALTRVVVYRLPVAELSALLQRDAALEYHFLVKVTHELRRAQKRAIMMGRPDAAGRLAMFLVMMRRRLPNAAVIPLPMSRTDVAGYIGHSLEAVSRAATRLARQGIIAIDRHQVKILDPLQLERLASNV